MAKNPAPLLNGCKTVHSVNHCPCGSGSPYTLCCLPAISGQTPAATAEALMRSRYSAFARGEAGYLLASTHPELRSELDPGTLIDPQTRWLQLQILNTQQGGCDDSLGQVHFIATFAEAGRFACLEENSHFCRIDQHWYYRSGDARVKTLKPERNLPCLCGSGIKFKRCCAVAKP